MTTSPQKRSYYEFGPFRIDPLGRLLLRGDELVPTTPKQFDILLLLVENRGQVVEKEQLMREIWPDTAVEEANLTTNIYSLRKVLGESGNEQQFIQTLPRRGYRFVSEVREVLAEEGRPIGKEVALLHLVTRQGGEGQLPDKALTPNVWERLKASRKVALLAVALVAVVMVGVTVLIVNRSDTPGAPGRVKTLAVLPFKPLVAESRNEELEMGMTETLINKLNGLKQLNVRPLSAVRKYTALDQDAVAAGRELRVDYVLEGRLQMQEEKTRATVSLLSLADGRTVWTDSCDEQCSTIFELQDAIAARIASALAIKLTSEERGQLAKRYTESTDAYEAYMKGLLLFDKRNPVTAQKSIDYLEQAIQLDPNFALAYVVLADAYSVSYYKSISAADKRNKKRELVAKALEIDDTLAEAHAASGDIRLSDGDLAGAEKAFQRALELNPNSAQVRNDYAGYLRRMKRDEEALAENKRAAELDPTSVQLNRNVALHLYYMRQYDEAIEQGLKTLELGAGSDLPTTHRWLAQSYEKKGLYKEAIESYLKTAEFNDYGPEVEAELRQTYATSGWHGFWRKSVELKEERAKHTKVYSFAVAQTYLRLGEKDQALAWLEKSLEEGARTDLHDPLFDELRSDPRFADLALRARREP